MRVALVVEGDGELKAVPALVAKVGGKLELGTYAPRPIKAGGHTKLSKAGELERFAILAASQPDTELVLIVLDVDDECAAQMKEQYENRLQDIGLRFNVPIRVCFCVREYECWFLESAAILAERAPDFGWLETPIAQRPHTIRGAKERLQQHFTKHYKPVSDQERLSKALDVTFLYNANRSFRRFVRALSGYEYEQLDALFAADEA